MNIFHQYESVLELAEYVAGMENGISSEEQLSEQFDEMIAESGFFDTYSEDDVIAISEAFNNWTDGLCKDGQIHQSQYNNYGYVGKWS